MPGADAGGEPVVELRGVTKDYHSLRPLRVAQLALHQGQSLAVLGFDLPMAEVLVNLITGANLPDSGEVKVFGRGTSEIATAEDWVSTLDRFGLVSDRAVLVEQFTVEQNLAMPISLDLGDMSPGLRTRVRALAEEVSLSEHLALPTGSLSPSARLRLRLGRALALDPQVLLAEHPNALAEPGDLPALAADLARIIERRRLASLILTANRTFASAVADEVLTLEPATGVLKTVSGWRRWFSIGNGT
jgi:ABC-type transporter Mla maintaining outer membrane lipid asymmetry ATPase subunit MlaF